VRWVIYNLTSTTQSGGVETSSWNLARELLARGQEVTVVGGQSTRRLPPEAAGVKVASFPFRPRETFPSLGSRARKLMERFSLAQRAVPFLRANSDCLLILKPYDLGPALWAARRNSIKVGFLAGGSEFYPGYSTLAKRLDYFAAVSRFTAGQIQEAIGLEPRVNHLGVDLMSFRPLEADWELGRSLGLTPGDEVLVSALRLVPLKGMQDALVALARLAPTRPRLKLAIAGEGPYAEELTRQASERGLSDRLVLAGYMPQARLANFYSLGALALFPSQGEEALGLSAAEAMACGLPVVASDLGGLPEVVRPEAGVLIPPKNPEALAEAVLKLLDDEPGRKAMGRAGRAWVEAEFSWKACVDRLEAGMLGAKGEGA
jgi:glycosyltransferase involved in cell wall biosynthesis